MIALLIALLLLCSNVYAGDIAIPAPPSIDASAYLLQDAQSSYIIASKNIDQHIPPASLTKMMTVYVVASQLALGYIDLDEQVLISEKAWKMPGSRMFIEVGKHVSVRDLLMGVIIQSGNDASVALAEHISGSEEDFAHLMNRYAQKLAMTNSHFKNSTGLPDPQHYMTAADAARLAIRLIQDMPEIYALHSVKEFTYNNITQNNRNKLLWHSPDVDGIKTGHTEAAGFCLVASAKMDDMRLISVVMGAQSDRGRMKASQSLFSYGFRFYETQRIYTVDVAIVSAKIWKGDVDSLALGVASDLYTTFPRGSQDQIKQEFILPEHYIAPVEKDVIKGSVKITFAGNPIAEEDLITLHSVGAGNLFVKLRDNLQLFFE